MSARVLMFVVALFLARCLAASAQTAPPTSGSQAAKPEIKPVPASYTSPSSGKEMYDSYCASCHGVNGKGDGPAAPALKVLPTNLTTLAVKNGGTFPGAHVASEIRGEAMIPGHGSKQMPVWGPIFMAIGGHSTAQVQLRIRNLGNYLESIQGK